MLIENLAEGLAPLAAAALIVLGPPLLMGARRRISGLGILLWLAAAALGFWWTGVSVMKADDASAPGGPWTVWMVWPALALATASIATTFLSRRTQKWAYII